MDHFEAHLRAAWFSLFLLSPHAALRLAHPHIPSRARSVRHSDPSGLCPAACISWHLLLLPKITSIFEKIFSIMNVLIVYAHPDNVNSFNAALKNVAEGSLSAEGHRVEVSDLYRMNFKAVGDLSDQPQPGQFAPDIKAEMEKFEKADLVIFNFPLWWFSVPAILKGWVDRVFASGFAYGHNKGMYERGPFKGKKALLTFTTGSPEDSYGENERHGKIEDMLFHIHHGMFSFVGMQVLDPFIAFSPGRVTEEERKKYLEDYSRRLKKIFEE
jgi:NAD(P)H dehydrogenase (quinone)